MSSVEQNKQQFVPLIQSVEAQYNLPENFLYQLIQQESAFRSDIINCDKASSAGAKGIAQFMPDTARSTASQLGIPESRMWQPENQIKMAGHLLNQYLNKYRRNSNPNISKHAAVFAYAEYNAGGGNIKKALRLAENGQDFLAALPKETQGYVQSQLGSNYQQGNNSEPFTRPTTATKKIFENFSILDKNINNIIQLKSSSKQAMADFLLGRG